MQAWDVLLAHRRRSLAVPPLVLAEGDSLLPEPLSRGAGNS